MNAGPAKLVRNCLLGSTIGVVLVLTACLVDASNTSPHLAIYIVDENTNLLAFNPTRTGHVPVLTNADIISYEWRTHTLLLRNAVWKRLPQSNDVGVKGKPFVVVADGTPCYRGAFWTSITG